VRNLQLQEHMKLNKIMLFHKALLHLKSGLTSLDVSGMAQKKCFFQNRVSEYLVLKILPFVSAA
jgi:hypothetical protein